MGEGQESAWPNLALRAEIKPCIEKNSISTHLGLNHVTEGISGG